MISALVGHLVGDYLLQNDWMAQNKKASTLHCLVHCLIWTACVCLFAGWYQWWVITILFGTHFIQDRTQIIRQWMWLVGQESFATKLAPWSIIIVDNVWHILTIWLLWKFGELA